MGHYIIEIRDDDTYNEAIDVKIRSSAEATLTIRAAVGSIPAVESDKNNKPALKVSFPFVTVEGLRLIGAKRSAGVHINWADDVTVRGRDICGADERSTQGVFIQGAQRALVVDNAIHDNGVGIIVFDAKDGGNMIRNNRIYDNAESGIWIYKGSANSTVVNNTLFSNFIEIQLGTSMSSPAAAVRSEKV